MTKAAASLLGALLLLIAITAGTARPSWGEAGPYRLDSQRETAIFAGGLLLGAIALEIGADQAPLDSAEVAGMRTAQSARLDRNVVERLDTGAIRFWSPRAADASDLLVWGTAMTPLVTPVLARGRDEPLTPLVMYAETMLWTNAGAQLLKNLIARPRPYVYSDNPEIPAEARQAIRARRSFPSAHAANAFAAAFFLGTVSGELEPDSRAHPWIWAGGLTLATSTALLRVVSGEHFPSDVAAGALLGAAAGIFMPQLHRDGDDHGDRVGDGNGSGGEPIEIGVTFRIAF